MSLAHKRLAFALALAVPLTALVARADDESKLKIGGTTYTKWLWGNQRLDGSVYNFTTVPGEGYGDNGQGSEVELLLDAKVSKQVEVKARLHSRFNQNQWTNYGGFGGTASSTCVGGDCGEFDPRSNQYVKLRGVAVVLTPGYKWLDSATIGANDFGQFDPFVIGRIRYIDRDNAAGLLFQGSAIHREITWDATRISLPRLWAGPLFNTGSYTGADAAYGGQIKFAFTPIFDFGFIGEYVQDLEIDPNDINTDNGRSLQLRFRNDVVGAKFGVHPSSKLDITGAYYYSTSETSDNAFVGTQLPPDFNGVAFAGLGGFSPVPFGRHNDSSWKVDVDLNDPFDVGLTFHLEGFDIGSDYVSMMAARRESDVLLTEGHDAAFVYAGPLNSRFQPFPGNSPEGPDNFSPFTIGYGGWDGNAMQVPTINVDNEFTDFDEPLAETVIGWKGATLVPVWDKGAFQLSGEYSWIDYNTNWQAWGNPDISIFRHEFPGFELDTGPGINPLTAYIPFQDKKTKIALIKAKYTIDVGKGIDIWGKVKYIKDTDNRMTDTRFLPYVDGDCATGPPFGCANVTRSYNSAGNNTAENGLYQNPPVITVTYPDGSQRTGYQWKPFNSVSDDDRDLKYWMTQIGAGYQVHDDLYASLIYEYFHADLHDGNTAWQSYDTQEYSSGLHKKNRISAKAKYVLAGAEIGFEYQYAFGTFEPDFGSGFVPQVATAASGIPDKFHVPVDSLGFTGRYGGWNSLEKRNFDQQRVKAYMKIQF